MIPLYHDSPGSNLQILIVDQDKDEAEITKKIITDANHQAEHVSNGLEAIEATYKTAYDLVLMEIDLGELDGFDTTTAIRTLPATKGLLPIIALSKSQNPDDVKRCLEIGMSNFLLKPLTTTKLLTAIGLYTIRKTQTSMKAQQNGRNF